MNTKNNPDTSLLVLGLYTLPAIIRVLVSSFVFFFFFIPNVFITFVPELKAISNAITSEK